MLTGTVSMPCFIHNALVLTVSLHEQPTGRMPIFYRDDFRTVIVLLLREQH